MLACVAMQPRSWSVLALLLTGCQEPTAIRVEVSVQADCAGPDATRSVLRSTGFVIGGADLLASRPAPFPVTEACTQGDPMSRVGDLVVTPGDGSDGRIGLRVFAGLDDTTAEACAAQCGPGCIEVSRRLSFVDNTTLFLPIEARRSCVGVCCEDGETCQDGECVSDTIDEPCVDGGDCDDPLLPLALDVVATANVNSVRKVRVLGGIPPFDVSITSGGGQLEGSGRTYDVITGPTHSLLTMSVVDGAGSQASASVEVGGSQLLLLGGYELTGQDVIGSVSTIRTTTDGRSWSEGGALPLPLSGLRAVVWRDEIWFVGGTEEGGSTTSAVVYSSRDGATWTPRPALPEGRQSGHLWVTHDGLVYAGGTHPSVTAPRATVFRLTDRDGTWQSLASLPGAMSHGASTTWRDELFIVGGKGNPAILSSPDGGAWTTLELPLPGDTGHIESNRAAVFDDAVWIAGGHSAVNSIGSSALHRMDDPGGSWTTMAPLPEGRHSGAFVVHDKRLWYLGGASQGLTLGTNTVFSTRDGQLWETMDPLPQATLYIEAVSFTPNAP